MRRREVLAGLGAAAAWPLPARAQHAGRTFRIGVVEPISAELNAANLAAFRQGLQDLGYVEGRNLVLEYRSADGDAGRYPVLISELIGFNVDLIVTRGTPAALAAKKATSTIPVVMASLGEPLLVVASLAGPDANLTGLSGVVSDLDAKRIELLTEMAPATSAIAAFLNMSNPISVPQLKELEPAQAKGLRFRLFDVRNARIRCVRHRISCADRRTGSGHAGAPQEDRRACGETPATGDLWRARVRRGRRTDVLRAELHGDLPPCRYLCGQDIQRCEACRSAG
jgi:putative ABC transport system substrate-binding protein